MSAEKISLIGKEDDSSVPVSTMPQWYQSSQQSSVPPISNNISYQSNQQQSYQPPVEQSNGPTSFQNDTYLDTLDEPVWRTLYRDFERIAQNLRMVSFPFYTSRESQLKALRNWDLWGPLILTMVLSICLSIREQEAELVFSVVFVLVAVGAIALTLNVDLLGGNIVFFQSLCLLGYCLFPLTLASILCAFIHGTSVATKALRIVFVGAALCWSCYASIPFVGYSVKTERRALAVFPVVLLYSMISWFAIVKR